jgi:hypothetical protein
LSQGSWVSRQSLKKRDDEIDDERYDERDDGD